MSRSRNRFALAGLLFLLLSGGMYAWSDRPDTNASEPVSEPEGKSRHQPIDSSQSRSTAQSHHPLRDACDAFADSTGEPEDVRALMRFALFWPSLEQMVAKCAFNEDTIESLLLELAPRLEEGDYDAVQLAYVLGGIGCEEPPHLVDNRCHEEAEDASLSLADWRLCVQDGYEAYHDCVGQHLTRVGINSTSVRTRYIYSHSIELASMIDTMRTNVAADPSVDLEDSLAQLESIAQDRIFVEGIVRPDVYSAKLFSLSFVLGRHGDTQTQDRINKLLLFWGQRSEMIVSIQEDAEVPYDEHLVVLSP